MFYRDFGFGPELVIGCRDLVVVLFGGDVARFLGAGLLSRVWHPRRSLPRGGQLYVRPSGSGLILQCGRASFCPSGYRAYAPQFSPPLNPDVADEALRVYGVGWLVWHEDDDDPEILREFGSFGYFQSGCWFPDGTREADVRCFRDVCYELRSRHIARCPDTLSASVVVGRGGLVRFGLSL